jgi:hypothetical protein
VNRIELQLQLVILRKICSGLASRGGISERDGLFEEALFKTLCVLGLGMTREASVKFLRFSGYERGFFAESLIECVALLGSGRLSGPFRGGTGGREAL